MSEQFDHRSANITDPREIVSSRVFSEPASAIFDAFADPAQLVCWWGPKGFSSTVRELDFRPGGSWRIVLHGPDGKSYDNESEFTEIVAPRTITWRHIDPIHSFTMSMTLVERERGTLVTWRMLFDSAEHAAQVRAIIVAANEENFDRLQAHLSARAG